MNNRYQLVPRHNVAQQQTVDYFRAVQGSMNGNLSNSASAIGQAVARTTPISVASRMVQANRNQVMQAAAGQPAVGGPVDGMGALAVVAMAFIAVTGALSYQAGKAMAPNSKAGDTWGWIGVPVGIFTGPWGLGVMGIVSNSRKG